MKRPKTVGDAQKAAGLPSDTLKNPTGRNSRDDKFVSTLEKELGQAAIAEQMAGVNQLPDVEIVSAEVHAAWMQSKKAQGVTTRKSESGEELMVPYAELSEPAKELDRGTVKAVYAAIQKARNN
jgi:hypothetical protein